MNAPHFPPPRAKPTAYREPALVEPVPTPAKIVAHRPEPPESPDAAPRRAELLGVGARERTFWARHTFFARHPRAIGAALTLFGGALSYAVIVDGWGGRAMFLGPLGFFGGLFALLFGYPLDDRGDVPSWYKAGLVAAVALGLVSTAILAVLG